MLERDLHAQKNMQNQSATVSPLMIVENLFEQFQQVNLSLADGIESLGRDGASIYIAEGNRIYPGIWEHLDQAYRSLKQSGIEAHAYVHLRDAADRHSGIFDLEVKQTKVKPTFTGGVKVERTFDWKTNDEGLALARQACDLLKAQLPDVDWQELEADAEAGMIDLGSRSRKQLTIIAVAIALAVVLLFVLTS